MPTFNLPAKDVDALKSHASDVLQIAYQLSEELRFALIRAWFRPQTDSNGKKSWSHVVSSINKASHLSSYKNIDIEYWSYLEPHFLMVINDLIDFGQECGKPLHIYKQWLKEIQRYSLKYFDQNALTEATEELDMKRVIEAKNYLLGSLYPNKNGILKDINDFKLMEKIHEI